MNGEEREREMMANIKGEGEEDSIKGAKQKEWSQKGKESNVRERESLKEVVVYACIIIFLLL